MSTGEPPRVAITSIGRARGATLVFRTSGALRAAAIVKATFAMVQDRPMEIVDPEPMVPADQHRDGDPTKSVLAASDLVPYRPRADVVLQGHARAPLGRPTPRVSVRLMLARGSTVVLDKRVAVQGNRDPAAPTDGPAPFESIPLVYELAIAAAQNPVGIAESARAWPNVLDAWNRRRPVGFGPIGDRWSARRGLLAPNRGAVLEARIPDYAADFPWAFFNAAPEDQRVDRLFGDEWVGFEGMHAQLPRVQSCLPGVRAAARVYGPRVDLAQGQAIALVADTLVIDADRLRVSVVWRGSFGVASEQELAALHVFAGVETAAMPLAFPTTYISPPQPQRASADPPPSVRAPVSVAMGPQAAPSPARKAPTQPGTQMLSLDEATALAMAKVTPFAEGPPSSSHSPPPSRKAPTHPGTQMLSLAEATAIAMAKATPFVKGAAVAPAPRPPQAATPPGRATLPIEDGTLPPQPGLPFAATPFEKRAPVAPSAAPAGPPPKPATPVGGVTLPIEDGTLPPQPGIRIAVMPFEKGAPAAASSAPAPPRATPKPATPVGGVTLPIEDGTQPPQPGIRIAATPFEKAAPAASSVAPAPASPPPKARASSIKATQALSLDAMREAAEKAKGAVPFAPGATGAPRAVPARPLPAATPFDRPSAGVPPLDEAPPSATAFTIGEAMARGLVTPQPAVVAPSADRMSSESAPRTSCDLPIIEAPEGEPKTLGAHFLRAMARAQQKRGAETLAR